MAGGSVSRGVALWAAWVVGSVAGVVIGGGVVMVVGLASHLAREGWWFLLELLGSGIGLTLAQVGVLRRGWDVRGRRAIVFGFATGLGLPLAWLVGAALVAIVAPAEAVLRGEPYPDLLFAGLVGAAFGVVQGFALWGRRLLPIGLWAAANGAAGLAANVAVRVSGDWSGALDPWIVGALSAGVVAVYCAVTGGVLGKLLAPSSASPSPSGGG
jgi:hypothetical protein